MCGGFYGIGGHHHHHRRRRHRRRRHHLLLFFVFFLPRPSSPPSPVSPSVPRRRNMAPRQEIRPSTPSLSQQPRAAPLFPGHFPSSSSLLSSLLRCQSPPPPRCILNQSLGGNAITRHHDASTIFYFKLLYVLVPPPCLSPVPRFSSTARSTLPPPPRYVSARHTAGFAALLFCLGSSRALSLAPPFLRSVLPPTRLPPPPSTGLVTRLFY